VLAPKIGVFALVLLILTGGLSATSIFFYRLRLSNQQLELQEQADELEARKAALEQMQGALEKDTAGFEKRRQEFEKRLRTYHEWTEFPMVTDVADEATPISEEEIAQDRQVAALAQDMAAQLFDALSDDRYSVDGNFDPRLLTNDLVDFVGKVAQVYQPGAKHPILETSVEKLLKAVNHISFQLLFQLEQLPFNLKDYSLAKAYDHVQKGTKVYGYYKTISPILPYASYTWQLGRLVLGANPLLAGTWILGGEIVKRTGAKLSKRYIDRYSLRLISEMVRIVANESAMTFDPHYRYRDPNWVYGVELAELVHEFPLSRETLQQALQDLGTLPLTNSYDRMFLYRCLAGGLSPKPEILTRQSSLTIEQRRKIADRLERFFRHHVHGRRRERVDEWVAAASERLGVPLQVSTGQPLAVTESDLTSALASIGAFLIAVKERPLDTVRQELLHSGIASRLPDVSKRDVIVGGILDQPPMFFDYPDLDPESPLLQVYMKDLMDLECKTLPKDLQGFWAIREVCEFLRAQKEPYEAQMVLSYSALLSQKLDPDSPEQVENPGLVLALVRFVEASESAAFIYAKAASEDEPETTRRMPGGKSLKVSRWLVGSNQRLFVVEVREGLEMDDFKRQQIIWSLDRSEIDPKTMLVVRSKGIMADAVLIRGGSWASGILPEDVVVKPAMRIPGDRSKRNSAFFGPLNRWLKSAGVPEADT